MLKRTIDGPLFRSMLLMGAACLEKNKATIDSMNVFPVPDGDTGTNMSMTMQRAVMEINSVKTDAIDELAAALATGALKGARGNSGVILSQIFRGFSRALKGTKDIQEKPVEELFADFYTDRHNGAEPDEKDLDLMAFVGELARTSLAGQAEPDEKDFRKIIDFVLDQEAGRA